MWDFREAQALRLSGWTLVAILVVGCDCSDGGPGSTETIVGEALGTTLNIAIRDYPRPDSDVRGEAVNRALEEVESIFSTWRADSEISRFNAAPPGQKPPMSEIFAEVWELAETIRVASGGAFDARVGEAVRAAGYGSPIEGEIDLSAIAKGYAVDRVIAELALLGCGEVLVEIGGEIRCLVPEEAEPWRVGIERPGAHDSLRIVPLRNGAIATSGKLPPVPAGPIRRRLRRHLPPHRTRHGEAHRPPLLRRLRPR